MELAHMVDVPELDDPEISALKDQLVSLISSCRLGESEQVIATLGWDAESYRYIGRLLVEAGMLRAEGKKREKLERIPSASRQAESGGRSVASARGEKTLYAPIIETLSSAWVLEHEIQDYVIDLTASQGGRITGGRWSRPDITLAGSNEYRFVPGRSVELRTFEIKTHEGLDVTAVYEALSHRRAAHFAHVLVHVPECEAIVSKPALMRVINDAEEYGVGVTTLADPRDYRTWRVEVEARRANPDPAAVNAFINAQTGNKFKDKVLSWCRRV
jgi:hypothetical protein